MYFLLTLGLGLAVAFGFALGSYLSCYRLRIGGRGRRAIAIVLLGLALSAVSSLVFITAIWPPINGLNILVPLAFAAVVWAALRQGPKRRETASDGVDRSDVA